MKHLFTTFLAALVTLTLSATTYNFTASVPSPWTSSPAPNGYESSGTARGAQFTQTTTLTLAGVTNLSSVKIIASSNLANAYSLSVKVGSTTFGSTVNLPKENLHEYTFSGAATSGNLVVTVTKTGTSKSAWIKSIEIDGTVAGGSQGGEQGGEQGGSSASLDPDYVYPADPVMVLPQDSVGATPIDLVQNNIRLQCASGALRYTDIRIYAGQTLTITATKPIKAIRVDGVTKKGFYASSTAGTLTYASDSEADTEATPVLLVKDINAASLSLECGKQLQIKKLYVYFTANPDVEIDGGTQGGGSEGGTDAQPVVAEGDWDFQSGNIDPYYYAEYGTYDIQLFTNTAWYIDEEGYVNSVGDGTYLVFDFYPESTDDLSGTYTISDETLDAEYSWFVTTTNSVDVYGGIASGSITLSKDADGSYTLNYAFVDSTNVSHSGMVVGLMIGGESGEGGNDGYVEATVNEAITAAALLPNDGMADTYYYVYGYAVAVEPAVGDSVQTVYLADTPNGATNLFKVENAYLIFGPIAVGEYVGAAGILYHAAQGVTPEYGLLGDYIWQDEAPATTALDEVQAISPTEPLYDLLGRRVNADYRGIVIQDGRKYLLR